MIMKWEEGNTHHSVCIVVDRSTPTTRGNADTAAWLTPGKEGVIMKKQAYPNTTCAGM